MQAPEKNLPKAAQRYIWRLLIFYVGSVLAITVICPYTDPDLTNGGAGAKSSPFVAGIQKAGIRSLGSVVNAAILTSAWSAGNAYLYMSSRALYSMALAGQAPAVFRRCNRHGLPYMAVGAAFLFAPLAYLNVGNSSSIVFDWFVNLTTTSGFISWICCCIVYLRFRKAFKVQGAQHAPYRSKVQPWGSVVALVIFVILCLVNGFSVFLANQFTASGFLTAYISIPIFLLIYLIHKVVDGRRDAWLLPANKVNLEADFEPDPAGDEEDGTTWKRWLAKIT
jgi:amino acid transporter